MKDESKNVEMISEMLNSFSFNPEAFAKQFAQKEHRSLQQSLTRLCIAWLCECASDEYRYDGRNEASHKVAKALIESQDADFIGLPYI